MTITGVEQPQDTGTVSVTVGGVKMSTPYGAKSTPGSIAQALISVINQTQATPVSASLCTSTTCPAVPTGQDAQSIQLDAILAGSTGDTSISALSTDAGSSSPPFTATPNGTVLKNGTGNLAYFYRLTYSPNGNIATANDMYNGNWSYGYDSLNRLTAAQATGTGRTINGLRNSSTRQAEHMRRIAKIVALTG